MISITSMQVDCRQVQHTYLSSFQGLLNFLQECFEHYSNLVSNPQSLFTGKKKHFLSKNRKIGALTCRRHSNLPFFIIHKTIAFQRSLIMSGRLDHCLASNRHLRIYNVQYVLHTAGPVDANLGWEGHELFYGNQICTVLQFIHHLEI